MIFDCFKLLFFKNKNSKTRQDKHQNWSEDEDQDYSSTVLLKNRMTDFIEKSKITISINYKYNKSINRFLEIESLTYNLPTIQINKDFFDIFSLSYQKCLCGPLTPIPRPLKSEIFVIATVTTIKTINVVIVASLNEFCLK